MGTPPSTGLVQAVPNGTHSSGSNDEPTLPPRQHCSPVLQLNEEPPSAGYPQNTDPAVDVWSVGAFPQPLSVVGPPESPPA